MSFLDSGAGTISVAPGSSTLNFTGTAAKSLTSNGQTLYNVSVDQESANAFQFLDALNCNRLQIKAGASAGTIVQFKEGLTHTIASYVSGDWNGYNSTYENSIQSITAGSQHNLNVPTGMTVSYLTVKDSVPNNDINAYNGTNTNSGNNGVHWLFSKPVILTLLVYYNNLLKNQRKGTLC